MKMKTKMKFILAKFAEEVTKMMKTICKFARTAEMGIIQTVSMSKLMKPIKIIGSVLFVYKKMKSKDKKVKIQLMILDKRKRFNF